MLFATAEATMQQRKSTRRVVSWAIRAGVSAALVGLAATGAWAQQPAGHGPAAGRGGMMADRQAMMATLQAQERKLDELVAAMQAATGADKTDRVAAVVAELVAQHKAMHARMMAMMAGGGMMGGRGGSPAPAAPATPADHSQHH
jgi:cytochrome bd-type quinol oxidase subunit 1